MAHIVVSPPVKQRLDVLQALRRRQLGRQVTLSEIIEGLLAEHDELTGADA